MREPRHTSREPRESEREPRQDMREPRIIEDRGDAHLARRGDQYLVRMAGDTAWTEVDLPAGRTASSFADAGIFATDVVADGDGYRLLWESNDGRFFEWSLDAQGNRNPEFLTPERPGRRDGADF